MSSKSFPNLKKMAQNVRDILGDKKCYLLFAHNGTGKTRLSCAFKDLGKKAIRGSTEKTADTLYYNAFTEDLFSWNNDLDGDTDRKLMFNKHSRFFNGLEGMAIENHIRPLLNRYVDYSFIINHQEGHVTFSREIRKNNRTATEDNIKISRGEENIFIWCFFLAVAELAINNVPAYSWVKYIYIDDPISSLDDNNVVTVACHLAQLIKDSDIKIVVSTHHALFFNIMYNELKRDNTAKRYLSKNEANGRYITKDTGDTPFFHHVALLKQLKEAADSGKIYTYHFNSLRSVLEKAASFLGYDNIFPLIEQYTTGLDEVVNHRIVQLFSHGGHSLFEPVEMVDDNKRIFRIVLDGFIETYKVNSQLFDEE